MKTIFSFAAVTLSMIMLVITFTVADAQSQSSVKSNPVSLQAPEPASVLFTISIPGQYSSRIVSENANDAVNFMFKESDGTTAFLFQLNKISEGQWMKIKDQLSHPRIVDHKNGYIYYVVVSDKDHIKGPDNAAYQQVYGSLDSFISTIAISEEVVKN